MVQLLTIKQSEYKKRWEAQQDIRSKVALTQINNQHRQPVRRVSSQLKKEKLILHHSGGINTVTVNSISSNGNSSRELMRRSGLEPPEMRACSLKGAGTRLDLHQQCKVLCLSEMVILLLLRLNKLPLNE